MHATVVLAGQDIIVNCDEVGRYLFRQNEEDAWKDLEWKGSGLDLLWIEEADHADVFDHKHMRERVVQALTTYCGMPTT